MFLGVSVKLLIGSRAREGAGRHTDLIEDLGIDLTPESLYERVEPLYALWKRWRVLPAPLSMLMPPNLDRLSLEVARCAPAQVGRYEA